MRSRTASERLRSPRVRSICSSNCRSSPAGTAIENRTRSLSCMGYTSLTDPTELWSASMASS